MCHHGQAKPTIMGSLKTSLYAVNCRVQLEISILLYVENVKSIVFWVLVCRYEYVSLNMWKRKRACEYVNVGMWLWKCDFMYMSVSMWMWECEF